MTKKIYRKTISAVWLPIVGRARLTAYEYDLTAEWYAECVDVALILRAIRQVAERGVSVYSLGVIRADLVKLQRAQSYTQVGGGKAHEPDWKAQWRKDLEIVIESESNERRRALFEQLLNDLSGLAYDQAKARYREATKAL